jgi:hypothetical protein
MTPGRRVRTSRAASEAPAGAYLTIDGRRWRASDPGIPAPFRQELVNELMAARRAVRDAAGARSLRAARSRVNDAKVALGERGRAWWLQGSAPAQEKRIDATLRALLRSRGPESSICPSDVARIVGGRSWRPLMDVVRARAAALAAAGTISVWRAKRRATGDLTSGVLRYRLGE